MCFLIFARSTKVSGAIPLDPIPLLHSWIHASTLKDSLYRTGPISLSLALHHVQKNYQIFLTFAVRAVLTFMCEKSMHFIILNCNKVLIKF